MNFIQRLLSAQFTIPEQLRCNPTSEFIGRKLFRFFPFLLPHDKSYWGFLYFVEKREGLFLDIGANDGISALGFRRIHPPYRILSIEPNYCHAYALKRLKTKHLDRFDYKIIGAGRMSGQMTLHIPVYNGVPLYTAASVDRKYVVDTITHQYADASENLVIMELKIDIRPLDEFNLKPDIIKIDTEGFDYDVLLGLNKTIAAHRPTVMVEYNPERIGDLVNFFSLHQYQLMTYDYISKVFEDFENDAPILKDERKIRSNLFCVPKEKTDKLPKR